MKIGIGITTRNRPHVLKTALDHFLYFHTNEAKYVIVDDCSDGEKKCNEIVDEFTLKVNAEVIFRQSNERLGIAKAKNACLASLSDCDHIFLFDDDAWPKISGWAEKWVNASIATDTHHSMFNMRLSDHDDFFCVIDTIGEGETAVCEWSNCMGLALYFSQHCIKRIGGYDHGRAKNVYGYEHAQMSKRAKMANLTRGCNYLSPRDVSKWIFSADLSWGWKQQLPPFETPWLNDFKSSVTPEEAGETEQNSAMMQIHEFFIPLVDPIKDINTAFDKSKIDVIIPTKSNFEDLYKLIDSLSLDDSVGEIIIIADGQETLDKLNQHDNTSATVLSVPRSSGIHVMWNLGLNHVYGRNRYVAIINDDVSLDQNALSKMCSILDKYPEIGLVTPIDNPDVTDEFIQTTGFAGYCMVIAKDLIDEWRFDEEMMWLYGDNDIILWVSKIKGRLTGLSGSAHALNNRSQTIRNDPPPNFQEHINNDARLFKEKWGIE